jgi:hypothetical protein
MSDFSRILFDQPAMGQHLPSLFVLKDGQSTLAGDEFTRQLLTLYYLFLLQYMIMAQEWSDSTWFEAIETSKTICRLYPPPYESPYPHSLIRDIANRGIWFALVLVANSHNVKGLRAF